MSLFIMILNGFIRKLHGRITPLNDTNNGKLLNHSLGDDAWCSILRRHMQFNMSLAMSQLIVIGTIDRMCQSNG